MLSKEKAAITTSFCIAVAAQVTTCRYGQDGN